MRALARWCFTHKLVRIAKGPHVERVDSPFARGAAAQQLARDRTVAFANVHMDGAQPIADVPKSAYDKLISTAEDARGDGLKVELGGSGIQQATQQPGGGPSEFIGFIAAAVVLALAFGPLWATLLPLFTAILALGCGLSITGLLAHVIDIATFSPTLATLIGLGVGIDYSLFVVTRHRNAIKAGREPEAACIRALNTSGRAVLFAGGTVIVALLGLLVLGVSFLNGVAVASPREGPGGGAPAGAEPERPHRADRGAALDGAAGRRDEPAHRHAAQRG